MDYGNKVVKADGMRDIEQMIETLPKRYQTPFWGSIHELTKQVYMPNCTQSRAVELLIKICGMLIEGVMKDECDLKDLHYAMRVFNNLTFIFDTQALYDLYDGEFYGLIEYMDGHDNIDGIKAEYCRFVEKYCPKKGSK